MAIGINWSEVWDPVWKAVWEVSPPAPAPAPSSAPTSRGVLSGPPYKFPIAAQPDKTVSNLPPGMATQPWIMMFNSWFEALRAVSNYNATSVQVPLTGFSIQIADNVEVLVLTPTGVLATGTVILPANPVNMQSVRVSSSQTITALTVSATHTILNAPTTLAGGAGFSYIYDLATTTWLRVY